MHLIVSIIIGIVFFFFLGKALIETAWGICLIIAGVFCHILAKALRITSALMRAYDRLFKEKTPRHKQGRATRQPISVSGALVRTSQYSPNEYKH